MMKNKINNLNTFRDERQGKDTKEQFKKELFKALYKEPLSRRMVATKLGFPDQSFMVTQYVYDWIKKNKKAQVIGRLKCKRSGRRVQFVTTNPELFEESNQLNLFEV